MTKYIAMVYDGYVMSCSSVYKTKKDACKFIVNEVRTMMGDTQNECGEDVTLTPEDSAIIDNIRKEFLENDETLMKVSLKPYSEPLVLVIMYPDDIAYSKKDEMGLVYGAMKA